jgi:uncharacterized protein (TIGR03437 family)
MSEQTPETADAGVEAFQAPFITNIDPDYGKAGAEVTIYGSNLVAVTKATFKVGATQKDAEGLVPTDNTQVTVTVPSGLTNGNGTVTVSNPSATSNAFDFTVVPT